LSNEEHRENAGRGEKQAMGDVYNTFKRLPLSLIQCHGKRNIDKKIVFCTV